MERFLGWILVSSLLLAAACTTARRGEPQAPSQAPATTAAARGEQVFMAHCHQCHPGGTAGVGPALNNKPLPGPMIRLQVRKGIGAMPKFDEKKISDAEVDDLIEYLKELRRSP
jgi:mono/diheme cytochrome c family protein